MNKLPKDTYKTVGGRAVTLKSAASRQIRDSLESVAAKIAKNPLAFEGAELNVLNDLSLKISDALAAAHKMQLADIKRSVASIPDLTPEQVDFRSRLAARDSIKPLVRTRSEVAAANRAGEYFERTYGDD